jgi:hypothetical protein
MSQAAKPGLAKYMLSGATSARGYAGTSRMIRDDQNTNVDWVLRCRA